MSSVGLRLLAWLAVVVQLLLSLYYFVMGLGWGGVWYVANVVQGVLLLFAAVLAACFRPALAVAVPAVSFALMFCLQAADRVVHVRVCSPEAQDAVTQLGPLPDQEEPPDYVVELRQGCVSRFNSSLPEDQVIEHFRTGAHKAGWQPTGDQSPLRVEVSNDRWTVEVRVNDDEYGMYVLRVFPRE